MKRSARWLLLVAMVVSIFAIAATTAYAASVMPDLVDPWQSGDAATEIAFVCPDATWSYKVDEWDQTNGMDGVYTVPGFGTITISNSDGYSFDWASDYPVCAVIVKAGNAANVYYYDDAYSDTYLVAPYGKEISHATFGGGGGVDKYYGSISARKWYDFDMDGVWDDDENALAGWKIDLYDAEGNFVESQITDGDGGVEFGPFEEGESFIVKEDFPAAPTCWFQTWPAGNAYDVTVVKDVTTAAGDFGNVCVEQASGGYTIGYWSNPNGKKTLGDATGWQALLNAECLRNYAGTDTNFVDGATGIKDYQAWLTKAYATNMSYMLSAQLSAVLLNQEYGALYGSVIGKADYDGMYMLVDGVPMLVSDVIAEAKVLLCKYPQILASSEFRARATLIERALDSLNKNSATLIHEYPGCDLPVWE